MLNASDLAPLVDASVQAAAAQESLAVARRCDTSLDAMHAAVNAFRAASATQIAPIIAATADAAHTVPTDWARIHQEIATTLAKIKTKAVDGALKLTQVGADMTALYEKLQADLNQEAMRYASERARIMAAFAGKIDRAQSMALHEQSRQAKNRALLQSLMATADEVDDEEVNY